MEKYLDKDIYEKAKKEVDEIYPEHSAYKSMTLGKLYKKYGGRYAEKKNNKLQ